VPRTPAPPPLPPGARGVVPPIPGGAARTPAPDAPQKAASTSNSPPEGVTISMTPPQGAPIHRTPPQGVTSRNTPSQGSTVHIPGMSETELRALHKTYQDARTASGDKATVRYETLLASLAKQVPKVLERPGVKGVRFVVEVKEGKPIVKAIPTK
jgi:hypothetical protein